MGFILFIARFMSAVVSKSANAASIDQIKAAFLYNFAYYVNWPDTVKLAGNPFNICLIVDENIDKYCHILFLKHTESMKKQKLIDEYCSSNILLVSDHEDFVGKGGMIEMLEQEGKIKLLVNLGRVKQTGLSIQAGLLNVATIVE